MEIYRRLTNPLEVAHNWSFFLQGMTALNDPRMAKANYTSESFFKLIQKVIGMGDEGLVLVLMSKNKKPLGFVVAFKAVDFLGDACFYVAEIYSNGKFQGCSNVMLNYVENYARGLGLSDLKASTRRINSGGFRMFEDKWGFHRELLTFTKKII